MFKAEDESDKNWYLSAGAEQEAGLDHYKTRQKVGFRLRVEPNDSKSSERAFVHLEFSLPVVYSKRARV